MWPPCAPFRCRRGSCSSPRPNGCASAADRTMGRPTSIRAAGELRVPFTSGILIGIGESREERIEALLALRELNDAYGHLQEIIIQNFRPKPGTRMADAPA